MKKNRSLIFLLVFALVATTMTLAGCGSKGAETPVETAAVSNVAATETAETIPEKKETVTVRASVPIDWIDGPVRLWAWKDGGEDVYEAWPGEELIPDDTGWFTTTVPGWVDRIIVNGYEGTVQTADVAVDAGYDIWVLVYDDLAVDVFYEDIFSDYEYSGEDIYMGPLDGMEDHPFVQAALAEDFETMKELLPDLEDKSILTDWTFNDFNYWYASEAVRSGDYATAIEFFDYCAYEDNRQYARLFERLVAGDLDGAVDIKMDMGFTMLDGDLDMEWSEIMGQVLGKNFAEGSLDAKLWEEFMKRRMWTNQPDFTENSLVFGEHSSWEAEGYVAELQGNDYSHKVDNLNSLYAKCGSNPKGKVLVIRSQRTYPQGGMQYVVDLLTMDYLGYDLYPADLSEVEYVIIANYDYFVEGNYQQTFTNGTNSVIDYFTYLRMKGAVQMIQLPGSKSLYQSETVFGGGEVEAHFSDKDYQCSSMPETGVFIKEAVAKARELNAA